MQFHSISIYLIAYLLAINIITFIAYGIDKQAAIEERRRISEATLITLALFGGSPGALLAMRVFHHKTRKPRFFVGIPLIMVMQIIALYLYMRMQ